MQVAALAADTLKAAALLGILIVDMAARAAVLLLDFMINEIFKTELLHIIEKLVMAAKVAA